MLGRLGSVSERPKEAVCKTAAEATVVQTHPGPLARRKGSFVISKLSETIANDPVKALALAAALVALASTPIAFAVLGRMNWFEARRGRVMLKPSSIGTTVHSKPHKMTTAQVETRAVSLVEP